jgi:hypothetical protein
MNLGCFFDVLSNLVPIYILTVEKIAYNVKIIRDMKNVLKFWVNPPSKAR